jgi:hypothetical protein
VKDERVRDFKEGRLKLFLAFLMSSSMSERRTISTEEF